METQWKSTQFLYFIHWDAERKDLMGLQCLFWPARAKLIICAADSLVTSHFSSPHPLNKRSSPLRLSLPLSIVLRTVTRFWMPTDVFILSYACALITFFLPQVFTPFHICVSLFFSFFWFLLFFSLCFSLIPIFTRTSFVNFILLRASLDATISLSVSVFIRLNPRVTSGFFQLIYLLTPPE